MVTPHLELRRLTAGYGEVRALHDVSFTIAANTVCAIVGPAGSGKTTLLRCLNRTLDFAPTAWMRGEVLLHGAPTSAIRDVLDLRRRIGMVFPLPVGLPLSVYENVAYAPRLRGLTRRADLDVLVERCLRQAMLWDEVKDRLRLLGTRLSGGQQQRLTLARALSLEPEILCLDEFSIAIDPVTTMRIEEVLAALRASMTIVLVTNLVPQARRMADQLVFMNAGRLVEWGPTQQMFESPANALTRGYLDGQFG